MSSQPLRDLLDAITEKALSGETVERAELLAVLSSDDDDLMDVVAASGVPSRTGSVGIADFTSTSSTTSGSTTIQSTVLLRADLGP